MEEKYKFATIDPESSSLKEVHNLLLGGVSPRPIALVSTISNKGINNLAPFSFFNAFGANPPYVVFSPSYSGRDGSAKDTLINVQNHAECVIQAVPYSLVEQVSLASTSYPPDVDEFIKSGLTPIDSQRVKPKRVQESPFQMECIVEQIISLGGTNGSGNLVVCKVILFHVNKEIYHEGTITPQAIDLVGRNSGNYYTRASGEAIFEVKKPRGIGIGIDQLPPHIKTSHFLTANQLAQLGGVEKLPQNDEITEFIQNIKSNKTTTTSTTNDYTESLKIAYSLFNDNKTESIKLIEKAAGQALIQHNVPFALKALLSILHLR